MKTYNRLIYKRLAVFVALLAGALFAACSDEDTTAPDENHPPEITFAVAAVAVPKGPSSPVTLSVTATDPDGDDVSVTWDVTRGTLNASQQGSASIAWTTPTSVGRDTITATATDGKGGTATIVETILVGTVKQSGISLSQTWGADQSPYIVRPAAGQNKQFLIPNVVLRIAAGCELLIDSEDEEILLEGVLIANGTPDNPVSIRPNIRAPEAGYWKGITGNPNSSVPQIRLNYAEILYAAEATKTTTGGKIMLDGCRIMFASEAAVLHQSFDSLSVINSALTNNTKSAVRIKSSSNLNLPPSIYLANDSIAVNGDVSGATPYTDQAAVYIDMPDSFGVCDIRIENNEISRNGFPGVQLVGVSRPAINYNSIFFNELGKTTQRYNIRLDDEFGGGSPGTIDARNNFWGAPYPNDVDSVLIRSMIRDSEDVGNITVRVAIDPWLHAKP